MVRGCRLLPSRLRRRLAFASAVISPFPPRKDRQVAASRPLWRFEPRERNAICQCKGAQTQSKRATQTLALAQLSSFQRDQHLLLLGTRRVHFLHSCSGAAKNLNLHREK